MFFGRVYIFIYIKCYVRAVAHGSAAHKSINRLTTLAFFLLRVRNGYERKKNVYIVYYTYTHSPFCNGSSSACVYTRVSLCKPSNFCYLIFLFIAVYFRVRCVTRNSSSSDGNAYTICAPGAANGFRFSTGVRNVFETFYTHSEKPL